MSQKITLKAPLNRVEGDLEVRAEVEDGVVTDAWCSGTMFRGIEKILVGRHALDSLVITPRICGICTTGHLTAAARALDMIAGAAPPPNAVRIRNLALMTEHIQSDVRHGFLMFTADFVNPAYRHLPLYEEAKCRYEPFKGETVVEVIRETKQVLEILAILGGQWPHSAFMVPGGIVSHPGASDIILCRHLLTRYRQWYERRILGCSVERWLEVRSVSDLEAWLEESDSHRNSDLGFLIRFSRQIGLDKIGRGHGAFLSYGSLDLPKDTQVRAPDGNGYLIPAGFVCGTQESAFNQENVAEHVAHSWYVDHESARHPSTGETNPYASGQEAEKYSWAKAPRYDGLPAETGPLAEFVIARHPLFTELVHPEGPHVFARELARLVRPTGLIPVMERWLSECREEGKFYNSPGEIVEGEGFGLTHASRGALGHWVRVAEGAIKHYQVITPTGWHASPRDAHGVKGPMEEALVGAEVKDPSNPVELGHIVRSFDACLVCTVHAVRHDRTLGRVSVGALP